MSPEQRSVIEKAAIALEYFSGCAGMTYSNADTYCCQLAEQLREILKQQEVAA